MLYISTREECEPVSLSEAIGHCIAGDGGLFMPCRIPTLPKAFFNNIEDMGLSDIAYVVATSFFGEDVAAEDLKRIADDSFSSKIPLKALGDGMHVLELFHGPTLTFKDFGARFMARLMQTIDRRSGSRAPRRQVLVATTGNTGAATANGLRNIDGINVMVLYPRGVMSRLQEAQFTSLGGNIHPIEISGSIDDCKSLIRDAIADQAFATDACLTGANSINIARLLPQVVFYYYAYSRLRAAGVKDADRASYAVPCGNLSNLTAAVIARRTGLPMGRIIAATNANDCFVRVLSGLGDDSGRELVHTLAPSMDMCVPSNLPRLLYLYGGDRAAMRREISAVSVGDEEIRSTILGVRALHDGYTLDPHSATAYAAATVCGEADPEVASAPRVVLSTGHPAKSLDIMTRITGGAIELPVQLTRFMSVARKSTKLPPTLPALKKQILAISGR